jgi:hypothetical protein
MRTHWILCILGALASSLVAAATFPLVLKAFERDERAAGFIPAGTGTAFHQPSLLQNALGESSGSAPQAEALPIDRVTASMINAGMTKGEVESVLGRAPGNYANRPVQVMDPASTLGHMVRTLRWIGDDYAIAVEFDDSGRVIGDN